jgi:hypothetical protein
MGPKTKAYKILIHHSLTLTQTKNNESHQPLGKTKSNKIYGFSTKKYFFNFINNFFFKGQNLLKNIKISRIKSTGGLRRASNNIFRNPPKVKEPEHLYFFYYFM